MVEIGAGLGSLTLALVEAGASVTAVEIDRYVLPVLRDQVEPLGVRVVEADALTLDWAELLGAAAPAGRPWTLVANLPYNVAVPLVVRVLEEAPQVSSLLVMVQREVGERLAAGAGDEAYGAVSVKVAYWATAAVVGRVPASVFIPRPRVESVLVRLDRRPPGRPGRPTGSRRPGLRAALRRGAGGIRPSAQDAPALPRGPGRCPRRSRPRASGPRPGPRSWPWPSGSVWPPGTPGAGPEPDPSGAPGPVDERSGGAHGAGQADPLPAGHRRPGRRLPPARVGDGHRGPGRHPRGRGGRRAWRPRDRSGGRRAPRPGWGPAASPPGRTTWWPGPWPRWAARPGCALVKRIPPGPGWAAGRPMPPPCSGGPAAPTRAWPPRSGPTCRSA